MIRATTLSVLMGMSPVRCCGGSARFRTRSFGHEPATAKQRPAITAEEVGYFGNANVAHQVTVFMYSSLEPSAGNHVTVCLGGKCGAARGHNAKLAWYSASFKPPPLAMGAPVRFTAMASDAGRTCPRSRFSPQG